MLAATITTLVYFILQSALARGTPCWDESMSPKGRNGSCVAPQAFLIFGHGRAVHRMDLDGRRQRRVVTAVGRSVILDYHYRQQTVYWANTHTGVIYKALRGDHKQKVFSSDHHISGLAVDWIRDHIYWTSSEKGRVRRVSTDGKDQRTIIRHLTHPSSVAVEPISRFLFWLSGGVSIQRSNHTGHMKKTIFKINGRLKALTVDYKDKRLFWVQASLQQDSAIGSCDYNGNVLHIMDQPIRSENLGISIFKNSLYYNDYASRSIKRVDKYGGEASNVNKKVLTKAPVSVKVVHPLCQPLSDPALTDTGCDKQSGNCVDVCSSPDEDKVCQCTEGFTLNKHGAYCEDVNECAHWNHGCSLGCENVPGSYFCTCPEGYALLSDKKTCQEIIECNSSSRCGAGCLKMEGGVACVCPEGSVLQEDGQACTGCSSVDRGGCSQICTALNSSVGQWECGCLPGYQLHQDGRQCTATGPDPFLLVSTLVDVRRMNPDGTGEKIVVSEPTGRITGLDYDPVNNHMYFSSSSRLTIERISLEDGSRHSLMSVESVQGLTIDWVNRRLYWTDQSKSTVESSSLVGFNRETVISDGLQKPRAIAVHPLVKRLFWTDVGARPVVGSSSLEGQSRVVISGSDLLYPTGLSIDFTEHRLWWCDQGRGLLQSATLDGSDHRTLAENQVGRPYDVAVFEDRLWVSDQEHHQIRSLHKRTGKELEQIHSNMVQPASVVMVHPMAKPGADMCLHKNGGCAQVCESELGLVHCSCLPHYTLSSDGRTCNLTETSTPTITETHSDEPTTVMDETTSTTDSNDLVSIISTKSTFSDKMVSDEHECSSLHCDVNAQCLLIAGGLQCVCQEGFTGDGQLCVDINECEVGTHDCDPNADCVNTEGSLLCTCHSGFEGDGHMCRAVKTTPPVLTNTTPGLHNNHSVESCPSTHESYCLYQGVCFYFPEMKSYGCNCALGYMGERCQFSDLEWWELQREEEEEEKRKNITIASCMVGLISLLSIAACVTYCYGTRRLFRKRPPDDSLSETSVSVESMSTTTTVPPFSMTTPRAVPLVMGCPRRATCPSCSSQPDDNMEDSETLAKHNRAYECSIVSAVAMETDQNPVHQSSPVSTFSTFKPQPQCPGPEPPAS